MNEDLENMTASDLFDKGWTLQQELDKSNESESSSNYLIKRKKAIEILKKSKEMLDELHLFSENESLDEISTNEIRYFLNDALLGWLLSKVNSTQPDIRLVALEEAKEFMISFLKLTKNYGWHNFNFEKFQSNKDSTEASCTNADKQAVFDANLLNQAYDRNEKIKRFKEQKELESQLNAAKLNPNIDEEQKRKFYKSFVRYWTNKTIDELKVLIDEINILKSIELEKLNRASIATASSSSNQNKDRPPGKKPYIITRDALQAKVFGAGYPSVPVYSIEEFYDQLADKGMMPKHDEEKYAPVQIGGGVTDSQKDKEKADKDLLEDKHDDEELRKQRNWDEFKDENKRGAGNRFNRS